MTWLLDNFFVFAATTISCLWFGTGILVAYERSKNAYQEMHSRLSDGDDIDPIVSKRAALFRAIFVFFGWTVAGIIGVIIWIALKVFLFFGEMELEGRTRSHERGKSEYRVSSTLLLGVALLIADKTILSVKEYTDNFVIILSFLIVFIVILLIFVSNTFFD